MGTKRKERDEEGEKKEGEEHHGSTLFVTSLPYTLTSVDLQTLFSDYAPVRKAFVVLDKESKVSKGVGYVSFAVREDAERLVEELKDGVDCQARKVRVQWPGAKPTQDADSPTKPKPRHPRPSTSTPRAHPTPAAQKDPNALRTIVITGLPASISSKEIWKKVRKQPGAEKVIFPVELEGKTEEGTAHVLYDTPSHALSAVQALHAHTFKGSLLSVVLKKRLDSSLKLPAAPITAEDDPASTADHEEGKGKGKDKGLARPNRAGRLIVRNLPFHIGEEELRRVFLPFGPIYSIEIPTLAAFPSATEEEGKQQGRKPKTRGFAFVWMLTRGDAQKALEGVNGMVLGKTEGNGGRGGKEGRTVAVDWALSKERWEREVEAAGEEGEGDVVMGDADEGEGKGEDDDDNDNKDEDDDEEVGSEAEIDDDIAEDGAEVDEDEDEVDNEEEEEEEEDVDDDDDEEDENTPKSRPLLPQTDVGTTLFVRNIPFEATEDELRTTFRTFGPLRYARITLDPESGRSRGTGFVCFWNKEHADSAITAAELLAAEAGTSLLSSAQKDKKEKRLNPFAVQSLLTPDPSSTLARGLVLQGRTLSVVRAVERGEATRLREEGEKRREKEDKRNLYLMREGVIFPNTPAAATIPSAELDRRVSAFNTRRALLRSNPSLYISKTRLSVRQIPTFATDRTLKRLAIHAVREFEREVRAGEREGLTRDEVADPGAVDPAAGEKGKEKKRGERQTAVVQAKIVRQQERVDALSGKGKSKGYGFLEMKSHADALRVLRWANNNPEVGPLMSGWWKEELEEGLAKLGEQMKGEKEGEKREEMNDRIRKMRERIGLLERGAEKVEAGEKTKAKEGKGLIMEFSIENVQVVRRRKELVEGSREKARKRMTEPQAAETARDDERPRKRQKRGEGRVDESSPEKTRPASREKKAKGVPEKEDRDVSKGKSIGGLIGKKRRERKGKRAGGA